MIADAGLDRRTAGVRLTLLLLLCLLAACSRTPTIGADEPVEDIKAVAARAESAYAAEDWPAAAEAYRLLVEAMPQDANLWFRYANALARADQPDRAVAAYREVLVRDARYSKAWFNMGIVQLRQAASSFSRMEGNVAADDPLRAQAKEVSDALMAILGKGAPSPSPAGEAGDSPAN